MKQCRLVVPIWTVLMFGCCVMASSQDRYQPRRPTLSPYLDYFRADVGLLDRHNALVVPRIRAQQTFQQLQGGIVQQRSQMGSLQEQIEQIRDPQMKRTGTASSFMNYSHYYRIAPPGRSPAR